MKKKIISLLLVILTVVSMLPTFVTPVEGAEKAVSVWYFDPVSEMMEEADVVELYRGGEVYLSAFLQEDIRGVIQWQIEAENGIWVNIQGSTAEDLRVTYSLVQTLMTNDTARVRCTVRSGDLFFSNPVTIVVTDVDNRMAADDYALNRPVVAPEPLPAPVGIPIAPPVMEEPVLPDAPVVDPDAPVVDPDAPVVDPDAPVVDPDAPVIDPDAPVVDPDAPVVDPDAPVIDPDAPVVDPDVPVPQEVKTTEQSAEDLQLCSIILDTAIPAADPASTIDSDISLLAGDIGNEDVTIHKITIEYRYTEAQDTDGNYISKFHGQRVAQSYIAEVEAGKTLNETVKVESPVCIGYEANISFIMLEANSPILEDISYVVYYSPAEVSYTVRHYQQNVDDDEYSWVGTTVVTGRTEARTSDDAANTYVGFTPLSHYHDEIAADSSTTIDIYYDRNYYLLSFDLSEGYGVDPIYARFGAPISVGTPYKDGYTFNSWDAPIPDTMPSENKTYTASWTANPDIPFTIVYWLEDANIDSKYNYWGSASGQKASAGSTVQGETYKEYANYMTQADVNALDQYEKRYSKYSHADTNVVIKGDGSTVVNVYYNRNKYTLKFYYAASSGTGTNTKYYVIGGSTYRFGSGATISQKGDEVKLFDHYMYDYKSERGQVDELPTLNTTGAGRNYTLGTDTSTVNEGGSYVPYNYHYISFTAKYGEDISAKWPCDVFNSVTRMNTANDQNNTSWDGTEAFVSAWNGEHNVLYSQDGTINKGNQTIKGNYNVLDYKLLWASKFGDSDTVTYLCFWENGADIGWSVPRLFRYNLFVPVMDGQDTTGLTTKTYYGKTYYLLKQYDTCDNSSVAEQTVPAMNGFTCIAGPLQGDDLTKYDTTKYQSAYNVDFFYSRNSYTMEFVNGENGTVKEVSVPYGSDLSGMAPGANKMEYYIGALKNRYVFDGWCTSPTTVAESKFDFTDATMPANPLILYARWALVTYDVSIYPTELESVSETNPIGDTVKVTYNTQVPEGSRPDVEKVQEEHGTPYDRTFIGWFYKIKETDSNGEELVHEFAYDFATIPVIQDMKIYAKWRSNKMKPVEIHYVVQDSNTEIADAEKLMLRVNQARTFEAKTGGSLYARYQEGYFPTAATHSITPTEEQADSNDPLIFRFEYKQYERVPYQVQFFVREKDGTERPAFRLSNGKAKFVTSDEYAGMTAKEKLELSGTACYVEQHWDNQKSIVTELYVPDNLAESTWKLPDNYLPSALRAQKIIVPSKTDPTGDIAANTIKFVYTYQEPVVDPDNPDNPDTPLYEAIYQVQHFIQDPANPNEYNWYSGTELTAISEKTVTANPISIPGYTYNYDVTKRHMDAYNNTNNLTGTQQHTLTTNPDAMTGVVKADDSTELNFYYTVNAYPYQVMYLEEGSNRLLQQTKTTNSDGTKLTGLYGTEVTETAVKIEGYEVVGSDDTKSIYIQMEAGNTANLNTIVFYYKQKSAELHLSKSVTQDPEQAKDEGLAELPDWVHKQDFEFTVYLQEGFPKSIYKYTHIVNGVSVEKTVTADLQTIKVKLKAGESLQLHDMPMGTYTVTETYAPGFRTSVNDDIALAHDVKLSEDDQVAELDFTNAFPFFTGDLVIKKSVSKERNDDPDATEPFKVTVQLNPHDSAREVDRVITWKNAGETETSSFTVPALSKTDARQFTFDVMVPVDGEVKLEGVPVGTFTATEEAKGTTGYIYDYYTVKYSKATHKNDEVTGTNHEVHGEVHGGHPTAVTFHNTYKKGSLTINKTVTQEYVKDIWTSDTFTFSITGVTELPDGEYDVDGAEVSVEDGVVTVKDEQGEDPTITVTKDASGTFWSDSLTFENLPAGYYTVTETRSENSLTQYTVVGPEEPLLVNDTKTVTGFNFTNTFKRTTGNLQVSKEIKIVTAGSIIDENQEFEFEVVPKDGTLADTYACTVKTTNGTAQTSDDTVVSGSATSLSAIEGKLTFKLKHNQYILISALPVGDYLVKEIAVEGYDSSFGDVATEAGNYNEDLATITTDSTTVLNCQNSYPVYYSNLIVQKTVVTPDDHSPIDQAPEDDVFTFTVSFSNYSNKINLAGSIAAKFYSANDATPVEKALTVTEDTVTFQLKHGEKVDLNLPACNYTITESGLTSTVNSGKLEDHYTVTNRLGEQTQGTSASSTLISGEVEEITFTNTYKRHYADLIITTTCADPNENFVFDVTATGTALGDIALKVVLVGTDSQIIKDLPVGTYTVAEVGTYTVTEVDRWSWRESALAAQTVTLDTQTVTVPFNYGVVDNPFWLSGYSYNSYNSYNKKGGS